MKKTLAAFLAVTIPMAAGAIEENNFEQQWNERVGPYLSARSVVGQCAGTGGVALRYLAIETPSPRAALVVIAGHSESFYKYAELYYDLRDLEVSIYALDPRGQGSSDRLLADREKSYVVRWQDYVDDLKIFVDTVVRSRTRAPIIALGHSLGGGIAAAYLEQHPSDLDSAILSAPAVGPRVSGAAMAFVSLMDAFNGTGYVPGGGPYAVEPFETNKETHSKARHLRKFQDRADHPETRMGSFTFHWVSESKRMGDAIRAGAGAISAPVLVFQAEQDEYVDPQALESFTARVPGCSRVMVQGARHEMLIETDAIRNLVVAEIRAFIKGRLATAGS